MFTTGFTMSPANVSEQMNGESITWMKRLSVQYQAAICGSIIISEHNNYYNRFVFVEPSGLVSYYDKRHLFTLAGEQHQYTQGNEQLLIEYKGWKLCPFVCYDLRFPVWSRNTANYDMLLYVANWPEKRIAAWDTLLKARAIENMSYVVGVNRVGSDANNYSYPGNSLIIDTLGTVISSLENSKEGVVHAVLCKTTQDSIRQKLGFLDDKDAFNLHL